MEVALLHNTGAGKDRISAGELCAMLRARGFEPHYFPLKEHLDDPAILSTGEFVIAAGGDGSVRDVALRLVHTGRPLAPLPLGTANNIAASLGIRGTPEEIIAGWTHPQRRQIDIGVARGPWGERRFIEGVGVGLVGRAISIIESIDGASSHDYREREDEMQRDLAVFLTLAHEMAPFGLVLSVDGRESRNTFLLLEILNITRAGPRLELAPLAEMSDGMLDVVSVTTAEREKLKQSLREHLAGATQGPILSSQKARVVQLSSARCDLRIDDELVLECSEADATGGSPVTIEITVEPRALELVLPGAK
jgi:diacylglycerol kinase family enzyme